MTKKNLTKLSFIFIAFLAVYSCKDQNKKEENQGLKNDSMTTSQNEIYRPNFHFTPIKGWMNDPNGMFFLNGYYHLYFQHYPDDNVWGPMHWGHAISSDMVSWKEQPIALYPDELGYIFSGSAVVDYDNTSGFGKDGKVPVVAIFTYHDPKKAKEGKTDVESQAIAYSLDEGLTWSKYSGNPVIENPGIRDFRDPKVTWDPIHNQWILVLAADDKAMFYRSSDLKSWNLLSDFGKDIGGHGGVWECPDFFPMPVGDTEVIKWVLIQNINPGGPNGGSGTQYFVGDFDGKTFRLDLAFKKEVEINKAMWLDYGKDDYAGVTWSNIPDSDGRRLFMGWMSNWEYAQEVPTQEWRSAMTIARSLKLMRIGDSYRIFSEPVKELEHYRVKNYKRDEIKVKDEIKIVDSKTINLSSSEIKFNIAELKDRSFKFKLSNQGGDALYFGYDGQKEEFFIDRKNSGKTDFSKKFASKISTAPRTSNSISMSGTVILDKTSIELFYNNGETVMTEIFFPNAPFETLSILSVNENFVLDHIELYELKFN